MAYKKKIWVDVPDPSNMPEIPEGQEAVLALDADNLNRIEEGIEDSLSLDGGVLRGDIYLKDKENEENKYIQRNYITGLIDYLNNEHQITLMRTTDGAIVYQEDELREDFKAEDNFSVPAYTDIELPISYSNVCSFDFVRPINYQVPFFKFNFAFTAGKSKSSGSLDRTYAKSVLLRLKNANGDTVSEFTKSGDISIPWGEMDSGTYSFDVDCVFEFSNDSSSARAGRWGIYIEDISIKYNLRNIITYPQITE